MLSLFRRDVLDEIWDLIESVSEGFPTYSSQVGIIDIHRNIFKYLLLQNHLAQMLEIIYVALASGPLTSLFRKWDPKWPCYIGSCVPKKRNILKHLLLKNCLAQVLKIFYVALPYDPFPNLFERGSRGLTWLC